MKIALDKNMPAPKPERGGAVKAVIWAIIALALLGGATFWLLSDPEDREEWRSRAADMIDDKLASTPLAGLGNILRDAPPPPPPEVLNPPTDKGTLSGRRVTGTIASPIDVGEIADNSDPRERMLSMSQTDLAPPPAPQSAENETKADALVFSPEPLPPVTEDRNVPPDYLAEIAQWLASRYRIKSGSLAMNAQSLNHICGVTIAAKTQGGRAALLNYAFQPNMITGLYNLYIDRFMNALEDAAAQRGFTNQQNAGFYRAIAGRCSLLAGALDGILKTPTIGAKLNRIERLSQESVEINAQLSNAVFEMDDLRENNASQQQLATAQLKINGLSARYRRSLDDYEKAKRSLAAEIRRNSGQRLEDDSMLYIAAWVERRLSAGGQAQAAVVSCINILRDLAGRCQAAAR